MFFPIGDSPNPPGFRAWITWLIIAINVLIYLALSLPLTLAVPDPADPALRAYFDAILPQLPAGPIAQQVMNSVTQYDLYVFAHGFKPALPALDDLFSAMFLHSGVGHLLGNMLFLWIYGDNVEHRLGRVRYLLAYLLTGVAATLGFSLLDPASTLPMIGASGAISGVLGFYFLLFPRNVVRMAFVLFPFGLRVFNISARWVLGAYVLIDNVLPLLIGAASGVAYGAHLGGFIAGVGLAWIGDRVVARQALANEAPATDKAASARHHLLVGIELLNRRQPAAAWHHLLAAAEEGDPDTAARALELMRRIQGGGAHGSTY